MNRLIITGVLVGIILILLYNQAILGWITNPIALLLVTVGLLAGAQFLLRRLR